MYGLEDWVFKFDHSFDALTRHFKVSSLKGFGISNEHAGIIAAGAILSYLSNTQHHQLEHITNIQKIASEAYVWIDQFTINNLELIYPSHQGGHSLLSVLDKTITPMGGRCIKRWLLLPLKNIDKINQRLDIVENLIKNPELSNHLEQQLEQIADLERLISKVSLRKISPREFTQLLKAHQAIDNIKAALKKENIEVLSQYETKLDSLSSLQDTISKTMVDEPPVSLDKGHVIRAGVSSDLDELRAIQTSGKEYLHQMKEREVQSTGIPSLKIAFNNVFGYYIEVRNAHKDKVPENWIRKQTLVNAERYITEELKTYEEKILGAEDKIRRLESELYDKLITAAFKNIVIVQKNAELIASLDCLYCFSVNALRHKYRKPNINQSNVLDIKDSRHPVIEQQLDPDNPYVANDVYLDDKKQQIMMITGPNMAGKSALLRQVALITIMAQMGSFVPASAAEIGIVDKVFTRVGASDNISSGESTFMVEMNETASIINNLSEKSLILLDEIGRGTSTFDGVSLAWSITEYLHHHPTRPKTLFATHYHELNELATSFERIENFNVSVKEIDNKILFLRKLTKGGSEHSFGINVAEIAGMPQAIINRANEVLKKLEESRGSDDTKEALKALPSEVQMNLFQWEDPKVSEVIKHLEETDINNLTPMDAMIKISEIQKKLKED
jgi:DNA mismatch repair protein MutS